MGRVAYIIAFMALIVWGCSNDGGGDPSRDSLSILSQIALSNDKLSENDFTPGTRIGLYVVPYNGTTQGELGRDDYVSNVEYIYNGTSWQTATGTLVPWPAASRIDLYAYYPYDVMTPDPRNHPFTVRSDQSTIEGYYASDFLLGAAIDTPPSRTVPVTFFHKLSRLNVNVNTSVPELEQYIDAAEISIVNVALETVIDLADGSATLPESPVTGSVRARPLEESPDDYYASAAAIVPPQTIIAGTQLIRIRVNGTDYFYRPTEDLVFQQGYTLTFYITLTGLGLNVSVENINEWINDEAIVGNVNQAAPRIVNLDQIDWTASKVHNLYYRNTLIGRACREYLFRTGTGGVDAQAIVVYPLNTEGEFDLTRGFVAQVMNRNRNVSTDEYEPNPANVHGGEVVFGTENNLLSYTAGNLPLVRKVELVSSTEVRAAPDNGVVLVTTEPYLLQDVDDNLYSIVKIGTQYWTSENVKMEHYRDGTPLQYYYFDDLVQNKIPYGALYTFNTVTDTRGIAPLGWRVPFGSDYQSLAAYVGSGAGGKLKANVLWNNLNYNDNVTGFSVLPAGRRTDTGVYNEFTYYGQFWSQTAVDAGNAYRVYFDYGNVVTHYVTLPKNYTQSLRLIME